MANAGGILGGGAAGAASFAPLGPVGAAAGGLLGLIGGALGGGKPREDAITHAARLNQLNAQRGLMDFATSVPGGSPDELSALAQARGALGGQLRSQQQGIYGSFNPQMGTANLPDMMTRIANSANALQLSTNEAHLVNALAQRRQALLDVANVGSRIQSPTYQPQSDLPQALGQIAQSIAYNMARKQAGANTSGVPGTQPPAALSTTMAQIGQFAQGVPPPAPNFSGPALPSPSLLAEGGVLPGLMGAASPETAPGIPQPVNAQGGGWNTSGLATLYNQTNRTSPFLRY